MLIILTRSDDSGVDLIEQFFGQQTLRVNVDEPLEWTLSNRGGIWSVGTNEGSLRLEEATGVWWWKVYFDSTDGIDHFVASEIEYVLAEFYAEACRIGKAKGNSPDFHSVRGKLYFLRAASQYFHCPQTEFVANDRPRISSSSVVAKSLSSEPFSDGKVLFTTKVAPGALNHRGFPWLLQETIEALEDVTVFIAGARRFAFSRPRREGGALDWRVEQSFDPRVQEWTPIELQAAEVQSLETFLASESLSWGRIDFLRDRNGALVFLEFNANGQFGFLDFENRSGLLGGIAEYLLQQTLVIEDS